MRKWIPVLLIVIAFGASAAVYGELSDPMPTHWNLSGEVDGWTSLPWGAFMLPLMLAAMWGIFRILPLIDPRKANYAKFKGTYETLIITVMTFMVGVHLLVLANGLGYNVSLDRVTPMGVGVLLVVIGNILPRTRPNWFVGIRTPWTLSSDRVWERTHRFGGHLFVAAGVVTVLVGVFAPALAIPVLIGCSVAVSVGVLAGSYIIWKQDPDRNNPAAPSVGRR
ncbi:MAG TPA: SdpI family protein [Gemmatimonadaceae bacterium]|nr:SdpI family protein [Gemmatimonadaceae bacterium]